MEPLDPEAVSLDVFLFPDFTGACSSNPWANTDCQCVYLGRKAAVKAGAGYMLCVGYKMEIRGITSLSFTVTRLHISFEAPLMLLFCLNSRYIFWIEFAHETPTVMLFLSYRWPTCDSLLACLCPPSVFVWSTRMKSPTQIKPTDTGRDHHRRFADVPLATSRSSSSNQKW